MYGARVYMQMPLLCICCSEAPVHTWRQLKFCLGLAFAYSADLWEDGFHVRTVLAFYYLVLLVPLCAQAGSVASSEDRTSGP